MKPSVSIIVPTYNRATSLYQAVDSILHQSYTDFELIIVNDGSTDNTSEILEQLASEDARIRVINKMNGGVSSARNEGIDKASGDYIIFIDDDDAVTKDYINRLMNVDSGIDLVINSYSNQIDEGPIIHSDFPEIKTTGRDNILNTLFGQMQNYRYCFFPIAKRFRRSIIKSHDIHFRKDIILGEDRPFILDYIKYANTLQVINTHSYIIKEDTNAKYRLSKGIKPADSLLRNFYNSYSYLVKYGNEFNNQLVLNYADNYLVEKLIEYLLIPMAENRYSTTQQIIIKKDVKKLLKPIKSSLIRNSKNRLIVRLIQLLDVQVAVFLIRLVLKTHS